VRPVDEAYLDAGGKDFLQSLNPDSLKVVMAYVVPSLTGAQQGQKFQFERWGALWRGAMIMWGNKPGD
jgi:hypothetical protein